VVRESEAGGVAEPIFLFDEDLIAHGKTLRVVHPRTIHVSSLDDAPPKQTPDGGMYRWCVQHGAMLVTGDFNMLRDQAALDDLVRHVGLRVIWVRQIKGQRIAREIERIVGRWAHITSVVAAETDVSAFVLDGNGRLKRYRTILDAVYEVLPRQRQPRTI
jgi:hypothetical protein